MSEERHESNRCLLDCLCKDEMKCCKSVPKMISLLDQHSTVVRRDQRSLTSPNRLSTMDNVSGDDSNVVDVSRTYSSLPNIVPDAEPSSDDTSKHSLRAKPLDVVDCSAVQVRDQPFMRHATIRSVVTGLYRSEQILTWKALVTISYIFTCCVTCDCKSFQF